jgi:hypothetical protein
MLEHVRRLFVPVGLPRLREQDERCRVRRLQGEGEIMRMNGYGSQWLTSATELRTTHAITTSVCPTMYCGVPKKRAAPSAYWPNASRPNGLKCRSSMRCAAIGSRE